MQHVELVYADTDGNVLIDNTTYSSFNKKFFLSNNDSDLFAIAWRPLCQNLERESNTENNLKYFWE